MKSRLVAAAFALVLASLAFAACSDDKPGPYVGEGEEGNVAWRAERDPTSNYLTSVVWITSEPWRDEHERELTATLMLYCDGSRVIVLLETGANQTEGDVVWQLDDGPEVSEFWTQPWWGDEGDLLPRIAVSMIRDLKGASRFAITTSGTPDLVFNLDGALETPVQPNIDNCALEGWR